MEDKGKNINLTEQRDTEPCTLMMIIYRGRNAL